MTDQSKPIVKSNDKKIAIISFCIIGILVSICIVTYFISLEDDAKREQEQVDYYQSFKIHSIYHGFLGDYEADARQLPDMLHSGIHEYDWLLQFNGGTHYFQFGDKPIVPTKEELCNARMSETDDCMDRMILGKLK